MLKHRWLPVLVLAVAAGRTFAVDSASVGIKVGVPFTNIVPDFGQRLPFSTEMSRFTVGPALEVGLPLGFAAEFDALYKRFQHTGLSIVPGEIVAERANSWEFVLAAKYRAGAGPVRPYVEAGVSFNRLSGFLTSFRTLPAPPSTQSKATETRSGIVVGTGLEFTLPAVRIVPGIRYSHWGEGRVLPSTNLVDFQVGILF